MHMRPHEKRKVNRIQKIADKKARREYAQKGNGLYVFRNKHDGSVRPNGSVTPAATITLPKMAENLKGEKITEVGPGSEFVGDDYFMMLVPSDCSLVRIIRNPQTKEEIMHEEKLILDQPATVTTRGVVEQVVKKEKEKKLNETPQLNPTEDILLNDDPISGVEILS